MILGKKVAEFWRTWRNDEEGSVAVETLLMVPLLSWAFLSTLVYFDAYRTEAISEKAALTIADMLSREDGLVNAAYLNGTRDLLEFLSLHDPNPELRITVVRWESDDPSDPAVTTGDLMRVWSKRRNTLKPVLKASDMANLETRLPQMTHDERIIVVETWSDYEPPYEPILASSLNAFEMGTFTVISPRFTQSLCWNNDPAQDPSKTFC